MTHWTATVALLSDAVGFVSGMYFCYPTYTVISNKRVIFLGMSELKNRINKLPPSESETLKDLESEYLAASESLQKFDPAEYEYLTIAASLLTASFFLKLVSSLFSP